MKNAFNIAVAAIGLTVMALLTPAVPAAIGLADSSGGVTANPGIVRDATQGTKVESNVTGSTQGTVASLNVVKGSGLDANGATGLKASCPFEKEYGGSAYGLQSGKGGFYVGGCDSHVENSIVSTP